MGIVKVPSLGGMTCYFLFVMYSNENPRICSSMLFDLEICNGGMERVIRQAGRSAVSAFIDPRLLPLEQTLKFNQTLLGNKDEAGGDFNIRVTVSKESVAKYLPFQ